MSAGPRKKVVGQKVSLRYAWYALFILFLVNFINYVDRMAINTAMETIKRYFEINDTKLGLIASSFTLVYALISLPMGYLSDRGVRTRIIAAGAFVWSIATTASGWMTRYWPFFATRAMVGAGEGIYAPSGNALIVDYFPKRLRNTAVAIFMSAMIVGGATAFIVAGLILQKTERFNMGRVNTLVSAEQHIDVQGWTFDKSTEIRNPATKKRMAAYHFKNLSNGSITVGLQRHNDKKTDKEKQAIGMRGSSLLFDIYALRDGEVITGGLNKDEAQLVDAVIARVKKHEGEPIGENRYNLAHVSSKFHIPASLEGKLRYEEATREIVFKGIMTKADKKIVQELGEGEHYTKIVGFMYSDTNFYYIRSDNWKWIFWLLGPPGLIIALFAFFLKEPIKGGGDGISQEQAAHVEKQKTDYSLIFKTPSVMLLMISNILATYCVGGLVIWLFPYVERYKGMESSEASMSVGPFVIVGALLGVIVSGILADKLQKKTAKGNNLLLVLAILLGTPFMYLFFFSTSYWVMVFSISMAMFFLSWLNGPLNALLMTLVEPQLRATLNAVHILLIHVLGDALSPIIIGYISDQKSLHYALLITPVFLVLGMIGFGVSSIFVEKDLKACEARMKAAGIVDDGSMPGGH
jgi:MFS family permease